MEERLTLDQEAARSTRAAPASFSATRRQVGDTWAYRHSVLRCDICAPVLLDAYYILIVVCPAHFDPPFPERLYALRAARRVLPVLT